MIVHRTSQIAGCVSIAFAVLVSVWPVIALAQAKQDTALSAVVTANQGIVTEIKHVVFYWEGKLSETSFIARELRYPRAKRGSTLNNIPLDTIKQVDMKPSGSDGVSVVVTLMNGKNGEFTVTTSGSVRGESDFGQADVPVKAVSKVMIT